MDGHGGWKQQPVILIEGRTAFIADHPSAYIAKLIEMCNDKDLQRGPFYTFIGEFMDGLDYAWSKEMYKMR